MRAKIFFPLKLGDGRWKAGRWKAGVGLEDAYDRERRNYRKNKRKIKEVFLTHNLPSTAKEFTKY